MKEWHFFEPVMRTWVVLFLGSADELRKALDDIGYNESAAVEEEARLAKGMCFDIFPGNNTSNNCCTVLWLREWEMSTLVHELVHLIAIEFKRVNFPLATDSHEVAAFFYEYWYKTIINAHKRQPDGRTVAQARKTK